MTTPLASYRAAILYLDQLTARPILAREEADLRRMETLLEALGHPERAFQAIQVAGTTGKGSTTVMAEAILRQAGLRTGAFTSPHLQSYRERIAVAGIPVDPVQWTKALNRLLPTLDRMADNTLPGYSLGRAAFLEVLWAMACLIFAERGVQAAVIETGLGGRLDPTSANTASVAVITNVSLDHVERLGHTLEAIAAEKSGLIQHGQLVVTAAAHPALEVIQARCQARQAVCWPVGDGSAVQVVADGPEPEPLFAVRTPLHCHAGLRSGLLGAHQRLNAACAVAAVEALAHRAGLPVDEGSIAAGLAGASIPGRLEVLDRRPQVVLDGAHNEAGATALAQALGSHFAGRRLVLLLGILRDKDYVAITRLLAPLAAAIVVSEPPWHDRAGFAEVVATEARRACGQVSVQAVPAVALRQALTLAGPEDLLVVAGSLYLVGAVRDLLCPETAERLDQ